MAYKTYAPATDIIVAFKSTPKQTGKATSLRFKYAKNTTPATKTAVTGTVVEEDGTYYSPAFQVATTGTYIVTIEYTADAGTTWTKVGETEIVVVDASASAGFSFSAVI